MLIVDIGVYLISGLFCLFKRVFLGEFIIDPFLSGV